MFGSQDDRRGAKDRVDPGGEYPNLVRRVFYLEVEVSAFAPANPIALPLDDFFRPTAFDFFDVRDQLFRVLRSSQEPLFDLFLRDRSATAPADSARRLL